MFSANVKEEKKNTPNDNANQDFIPSGPELVTSGNRGSATN